MNFDPAATGTHVAGGALDLIGHLRRSIDPLPWREIIAHTLAKVHPVSLGSINSVTLIVLPFVATQKG
jgi:hypothetical protein